MKLNSEQKKLVENNLGIVKKVIDDRITFVREGFISYEDIFQVGNLALCKAALKYDKSKSQFTTYAYRCILSAIMESLIFYENVNYKEVSPSECTLKNKKDSEEAHHNDSFELFEDNKTSASAISEESELRLDVERIIEDVVENGKLTEKQKQYVAAFIYYTNGCSLVEAAKMVGAESTNARNYATLGRKILRKRKDLFELWQALNAA